MCALAHHDYSIIAAKLGRAENEIRGIFEQSRFNKLRVHDLKECIRFLKEKDRRRWQHLRLQGRKQQLVDTLQAAMASNVGSSRGVVPIPARDHAVDPAYIHQIMRGMPKFEKKLDVENIYKLSTKSKTRSPFSGLLRKVWAKEFYAINPLRDQVYLDQVTLTQLRNRTVQMHLVMLDTDGSIKPFDKGYRIRINEGYVEPPEHRVMKGIKKNGLVMQPTLDITSLAGPSMWIDISIPEVLNNFMPTFRAVISLELVKPLKAEEVMANHLRRLDHGNMASSSQNGAVKVEGSQAASSSLPADFLGAPNNPKQCHVCGITRDLSRCSRCKARWYCGPAHQKEDWHRHKAECKDPAQRAREAEKKKSEQLGIKRSRPAAAKEADSSEDLISMDVVLTLNCPLSCGRIETAARGKMCKHPQCFDLLTFIEFSHQSHVWQCPVCLKALPLNEIVVDEEMNRILRECNEDVTQIRKADDGSYKPVDPPAESSSESQRKRVKLEAKSSTIVDHFLDLSANGGAESFVAAPSFTIIDQGSSMDNAIVLD
mmetsp:Transcript_3137/g.5918  ORF Transcript_3137/g.5918 Transcript_3137/m.5918 type:complete len:542 (-) Transcript_3137:83-1708(-)